MSREVHVRFWESAAVRFLRATRLHTGQGRRLWPEITVVLRRVANATLVLGQRAWRRHEPLH